MTAKGRSPSAVIQYTVITAYFLLSPLNDEAFAATRPTTYSGTSGSQLPTLPSNNNINLYYPSLPTVKQPPADVSPILAAVSGADEDGGVCVWNMDRRTLGLVPEISAFLQHAAAPVSYKNNVDQPLFTVSDKPPAGFESLNEPQTSVLDVYYNNRSLGALPATYTLTTVTFLQPAQLAELIPDVKDKAAVTQAFRKALPAHAELVCADKRPLPVCNIPEFKDAAVVFDVNKYRADIFIDPNLLLPSAKQSELIGPSSSGPSLRHDMNLAVAGSNTLGGQSYNFVNKGSLADGAARLNYQVSLSQSGSSNTSSGSTTGGTNASNPTQLNLQQLNVAWDHNRALLQMGYIETTGNTFIANQNILGVSVGTTLNTLLQDRKSVYGSPLIVFLDLPSQVSVYRDNRLLYSGMYSAGQQILDTSGLPTGSYPVTLKIQDNLGNIHEETRFFTKTQALPPKDYPIYYADVGYLTNISGGNGEGSQGSNFFPVTSSTPIAQAGVSKRIGSNWGVTGSGIASDNNGYLSGGLFFLLPYYQWQIQPEVIVGSDNDYGLALTSQAQVGKAQLTLNARRIWAKDNQANSNTTDNPDFDPLTLGQSQVSFSMGFPIKETLINLLTQWNKSGDSSTYSYGLSSHSILHHFRSSYLELNLSTSRSSTESLLAIAALNWNFTGKEFSHRLSSSYTQDQSNSNHTGPGISVQSSWRDYDAAQEGLMLSAGVGQNPAQQTANVQLDDLNPYTHITAQSQYTNSIGSSADSSAVTQYSGNVESQLIWSDEARPTLGAGRGQTAGVVVYINSDQPGQEFQVLNGGQVVKVVKTNEFTPIFLTPYRSYELNIKAVSNDFFKYDERPRQITLYPGNYQYLTWKAQQTVVIFTQVLLPDRRPFGQARLVNGTDFNYTDEQGYVQLEVFRDTREVEFVQPSGDRCQAELPAELPIQNGFASLESVNCMPLPPLPAPEQPSGEENVKNAVVQSGVE